MMIQLLKRKDGNAPRKLGAKEKGKILGIFPFFRLSVLPSSRGFTLVELLVSVGIFALMTALVVAKYGNFNQSVLLTNLAYDVAIAVRTAQAYGVSVKNVNSDVAGFQYAYGVHFVDVVDPYVDPHTGNLRNRQIILFVDENNNNSYDYDDNLNLYPEDVSVYTIKRGAFIQSICTGTGPTTCDDDSYDQLDVMFKRPDPSAVFCSSTACNLNGDTYMEITIQGTDNSTRKVAVYKNGQISVRE